MAASLYGHQRHSHNHRWLCVCVMLQVPSDSNILLSVLQQEQAALMEVQVSPPSLAEDLAANTHKGATNTCCLPAHYQFASNQHV